MKKQTTKRLTLNRETIAYLQGVTGGSNTVTCNLSGTCGTRQSDCTFTNNGVGD